jgi:5-methylcytosine-specific restriction enzyme subunit McrC
MSIPVQNLYYLLTYAWDRRLDHGVMQGLDVNVCPNLNTLFARVISHGVRQLLRRGMDRSYVLHEELTSRLRGRIDFPRSARRQTWESGKMECAYDELSHDVPQNQILKSTLQILHQDRALAKDARIEVSRLLPSFEEVSSITLHSSCFRRIQLHGNNRSYRFLIQLCELIQRSYLPDRSQPGRHRFRDILIDERTMAVIFEKFVRHFAARHLLGANVSAMQIEWDASGHSLPLMKTDVTIEWSNRKIILECKYYQKALIGQFITENFRSAHLYQLSTYLTNQAIISGWESAEGILLYPTNGIHIDSRFTLHGRHPIRIVTLDLNQPWKKIHDDLLEILR